MGFLQLWYSTGWSPPFPAVGVSTLLPESSPEPAFTLHKKTPVAESLKSNPAWRSHLSTSVLKQPFWLSFSLFSREHPRDQSRDASITLLFPTSLVPLPLGTLLRFRLNAHPYTAHLSGNSSSVVSPQLGNSFSVTYALKTSNLHAFDCASPFLYGGAMGTAWQSTVVSEPSDCLPTLSPIPYEPKPSPSTALSLWFLICKMGRSLDGC